MNLNSNPWLSTGGTGLGQDTGISVKDFLFAPPIGSSVSPIVSSASPIGSSAPPIVSSASPIGPSAPPIGSSVPPIVFSAPVMWIVKCENGSGTDPGREKKNVRILYYFYK